MKKIIDGKLFNTETAKEICYGLSGNFCCRKTTLYQKKNGKYFFHVVEDNFGHQEWIAPATEGEAKSFAEAELDGDAYMVIFGQVEE